MVVLRWGDLEVTRELIEINIQVLRSGQVGDLIQEGLGGVVGHRPNREKSNQRSSEHVYDRLAAINCVSVHRLFCREQASVRY
jgi:protein tyrosine phosphatase (PTP) superfamily phosphohydrolase (DUF442 family)